MAFQHALLSASDDSWHLRACVLSHFSHVWLFATLWTIAFQASLSLGFSRQKYWSGLPCCPPGALPDPGMEPTSLMSPVLAGRFFALLPPGKPTNKQTFAAFPNFLLLVSFSWLFHSFGPPVARSAKMENSHVCIASYLRWQTFSFHNKYDATCKFL